MSVSDRALQASNKARHDELCRMVKAESPALMRIARCLVELEALEVYKQSHKTFAAFVAEELGFERAHAYRLLNAAKVEANLSPIGDKIAKPQTESQYREVAKAPPEKQAEVVKKVAERAAEENRKPTAKDYKQVVGELVYDDVEPEPEDEEEEAEAPKPPEPSHHPKEMAGPLMAHVSTLTKLLNDLKKRAVERGGEWIDVQAISTQISALKYSLKSSIYYADCPACSGERCAKCKQSGFLPALKSSVVEEAK